MKKKRGGEEESRRADAYSICTNTDMQGEVS